MHHSVILWNTPYLHLVQYCLFQSFLQCFDRFVEQPEEIKAPEVEYGLPGRPDLDMWPASYIL